MAKQKILIVDDSELVLVMARDALKMPAMWLIAPRTVSKPIPIFFPRKNQILSSWM